MPCIFCIAAFVLIAGAVSASAIDKMEGDLEKMAAGPLKKLADTESVTKWEFEVAVGRKKVPVAVTVYKDHARVRIQILSHDLQPEEARKLQDEIAEVLGAEVVSRSDPEDEEKVKHEEEHQAEELEEKVAVPEKEKAREAPMKKRPKGRN